MSEHTTPISTSQAGSAAYRVLTVRTHQDTRAQLDILAQLNGRSVTDETRIALEQWVEQSKSDPVVLKRAEQVRAEIEEEATIKRKAIEAVLGHPQRQGGRKPVSAEKPQPDPKKPGTA